MKIIYADDFPLFEISTCELFEKFVHKHSEAIEYVKNQATFQDISKLHGQITLEFL